MRDFMYFICGMIFQAMLFAAATHDNMWLLALSFTLNFSVMMYSQFWSRNAS